MITSFRMRLYQRKNGIYYVALPKNKRRSLKTRNKQKAERLYNRIKKEIQWGNIIALEEKNAPHLDIFTKEYLVYSKANKRPSTFINDRYSLGKLHEWTGNPPLNAITSKTIDQFNVNLIQSGLKKSTVAAISKSLRAAFNVARSWYGDKITNPYAKAKKIRATPRPPRFYTEKELQEIFNAIRQDQDYHDLITCYLLTGMRRSELFYLDVADCDFKQGLITIRKSKSKWRTIPMAEPVKEILQRRARERFGRLWPNWSSPHTVTVRWVRLMKRLKINGRLHDLRHSFASHLAMSGEPIQVIQLWLGHREISTTMIYAHLLPEHMKKTLPKLEKLHKSHTTKKLKLVSG